MKLKSFLLCSLIGYAFFACSPRISTNITKIYPQQSPDVQVAVFTNEKDVPPQSEPIGTVSISDTGFSTNCDSATVFSLAKKETLNAGGNGLLVTRHLRPTIMGSNCHQISGTMLIISDFIRAENDVLDLNQSQPVRHQRDSRFSKMAFQLDAGYNWRTAEIDPSLTPFQKHLVKQIMSGFLWSGSVSYYFKNFVGIGLSFHQFRTSHEEFAYNSDTGETGELKLTDAITYVGPACAFQLPIGKSNWLFDAFVSIGYIGYTSKANVMRDNSIVSGSSVGFQTKIGLSYKITPEWGIGLKLIPTNGTLFQYTIEENGYKTSVKFEENKGESLAQIGLTLGLRYYINSKK